MRFGNLRNVTFEVDSPLGIVIWNKYLGITLQAFTFIIYSKRIGKQSTTLKLPQDFDTTQWLHPHMLAGDSCPHATCITKPFPEGLST